MKYLTYITFLVIALFSASANADLLTQTQKEQITRSLSRFKEAKQGQWVFSVFIDAASDKFVQFAATYGEIQFDFPIYTARIPNSPSLVRDSNCANKPPPTFPGEAFTRQLSHDEEERLISALNKNGFKWARSYCITITQSGARAGQSSAVYGRAKNISDAIRLVELTFSEVYLLTRIDNLVVSTDQ